MNILVIGSKGFIGSHVVNYYRGAGHRVLQADIVMDYSTVDYTILDPVDNDFVALFKGRDIDVCVNCSGAANVSFSIENPLHDYQLNTVNVFRLLNAIRLNAPRVKFVNLSSAAVYGNPESLPVVETARMSPMSPYGCHKLQAETICREFYDCFGVKSASLRIFSAYGPGLRKQLLWDFYQKFSAQNQVELWGTGGETRDFIFIDDLVQAIDCVVKNSDFAADVVNIANGNEISIEQIANIFIGTLGQDVKVKFNGLTRAGDPLNWRADIKRLDSYGYRPITTIEIGIKQYVKWIKEQR